MMTLEDWIKIYRESYCLPLTKLHKKMNYRYIFETYTDYDYFWITFKDWLIENNMKLMFENLDDINLWEPCICLAVGDIFDVTDSHYYKFHQIVGRKINNL